MDIIIDYNKQDLGQKEKLAYSITEVGYCLMKVIISHSKEYKMAKDLIDVVARSLDDTAKVHYGLNKDINND